MAYDFGGIAIYLYGHTIMITNEYKYRQLANYMEHDSALTESANTNWVIYIHVFFMSVTTLKFFMANFTIRKEWV